MPQAVNLLSFKYTSLAFILAGSVNEYLSLSPCMLVSRARGLRYTLPLLGHS